MKQNTKTYIIIGLVAALCVISFLLGNQGKVETRDGYEYIKSERLDSLDKADERKTFIIDSVNNEMEILRTKIDGTEFLSDERVEEIVKESYDELHNQTPSAIDTLFINEYDSAVAARRLYYNGQR